MQRGRKAKRRIASSEVSAFSEGYMTAVLALGRSDLAALYLLRHLNNVFKSVLPLSEEGRIEGDISDYNDMSIFTFIIVEPPTWDTSLYRSLFFETTTEILTKINVSYERMTYRLKETAHYQQIVFSVCVLKERLDGEKE